MDRSARPPANDTNSRSIREKNCRQVLPRDATRCSEEERGDKRRKRNPPLEERERERESVCVCRLCAASAPRACPTTGSDVQFRWRLRVVETGVGLWTIKSVVESHGSCESFGNVQKSESLGVARRVSRPRTRSTPCCARDCARLRRRASADSPRGSHETTRPTRRAARETARETASRCRAAARRCDSATPRRGAHRAATTGATTTRRLPFLCRASFEPKKVFFSLSLSLSKTRRKCASPKERASFRGSRRRGGGESSRSSPPRAATTTTTTTTGSRLAPQTRRRATRGDAASSRHVRSLPLVRRASERGDSGLVRVASRRSQAPCGVPKTRSFFFFFFFFF